jgi:hypothetical protein
MQRLMMAGNIPSLTVSKTSAKRVSAELVIQTASLLEMLL